MLVPNRAVGHARGLPTPAASLPASRVPTVSGRFPGRNCPESASRGGLAASSGGAGPAPDASGDDGERRHPGGPTGYGTKQGRGRHRKPRQDRRDGPQSPETAGRARTTGQVRTAVRREIDGDHGLTFSELLETLRNPYGCDGLTAGDTRG